MPAPRQQTLDAFIRPSTNPSPKSSPVKPKPKPRRSARNAPSKKTIRPQRIPTPDFTASDSSDVRDIHYDPPTSSPLKLAEGIPDEVEESEASLEIVSPKTPKSSGATRRLSKRRAPPTPPSPSEAESDEDSRQIVSRAPKRRVKKRVVNSDSDDDAESEEEEEEPPKRRKLVRGKQKTPSDDEDDLMDEVDSDHIIEQRLRATKKPSIFSQKLEELKRRKRGSSPSQPIEIADDEEEEIDEDTDEEDEEDVEEVDGFKPLRGARPHEEHADDAEEDDGFIVEDDENAEVELPAEFSRHSHQDDSVHFKVICQLFIHLAVIEPSDRPKFIKTSMKNTYFSLPITTMRRKLSSLRDSAVGSSAWKPNFTSALKKYPRFELDDLVQSVPWCDACHMGGRTSTILGIASGKPYNQDTFETVEQEEDEDEEDEDEEEEDKAPVRMHEFHLGRFCARRARVYHSVTHWEYLLFDSLRSEVEAVQNPGKTVYGGKAFVRVSWGGGAELPEDTDDPDQIMDWLDRRGIIQAEWSKIKRLMENSQNLDSHSRTEDD